MNEMQRAAVEYFEQGLVPLVLIGKRPIWRKSEWTRVALERCFKNAPAIGISCGQCDPPRVVVDYDRPEGLEYGRSICEPAGFIVKTQKGFHDHYKGLVGNRGNILGKGIDIKSKGGVVRMPPTPGVTLVKNEELTEWRDWFPQTEYKPVSMPNGDPLDRLRYRARRFGMTKPATEGNRDNTAFVVACFFVQFLGMPEDAALEELQAWNAYMCKPPLPENRLRYKIQEAIRKNQSVHRQ